MTKKDIATVAIKLLALYIVLQELAVLAESMVGHYAGDIVWMITHQSILLIGGIILWFFAQTIAGVSL